MEIGQFYIDGTWVDPVAPEWMAMINPATEEEFGRLALGSAADIDRAVTAARAALPAFSTTSPADRAAMMRRIIAEFDARAEEFAQATTLEMGSPISFSRTGQVTRGPAHLGKTLEVLERFEFDRSFGPSRLRYESVGVCGLITPWNWPVNQVVVKVAPALAAGCTMVLKPSEYSPVTARLFAEVMDAAGVPPGVFNLVFGRGETAGARLSEHPDVDAVSFTGSTRAGVEIARAAAPTVKRVSQELGGKTANVILPDADLDAAVRKGVAVCFANSGQSCAAPTRMLVPADRLEEACAAAAEAAEALRVGDPGDDATELGPVVNRAQFDRIQSLIRIGIGEGARLVTGGEGRPDGFNRGYYVRPTVFAGVTPDMTIARTEIFGPVLCILSYETEDEAVEIANDTPYGLSAHIQTGDPAAAVALADRLVAGAIYFNYPPFDFGAPFGGRKQSGNGREWGEFGLMEYLEAKSLIGDLG
ncbi:aldehyde dehydrogenase family protein [Pseudoroseicyclus sp. CXY001]|uniref:aldehyde dehydrogenase family protein n=1 Tax=Pseudoroseicyclus sp. CXY001 TaxID=3242492 RepID=UPI00358DC2D0